MLATAELMHLSSHARKHAPRRSVDIAEGSDPSYRALNTLSYKLVEIGGILHITELLSTLQDLALKCKDHTPHPRLHHGTTHP